jgi:chromosome segregation ATPase
MNKQPIAGLLLAVTTMASQAPVHAQVQRSGGGGETQKIMQQYQQVSAEKTALQAQVAQLKKDLEVATGELGTVKKELVVAKGHTGVSPAAVTQATAARDAADRNLEQSKQRMAELVTRFRETATNLKEIEADRTKSRKDLSDRNEAYDKCALDNAQLYDINGEILDRFAKVGLFTKASATEPFTRLTRTRIDNLAVEYRQRADQLKVKPATP